MNNRPTGDYTNIGYEALRSSMLAMARELMPEWTDLSPNDLGVLLVELMAYASDITLYYQSRIATNLLPATADEPPALVQLLRLLGYELRPATPATVNLRIAVSATEPVPIVIPAATQFIVSLPTGDQLVFENEREVKLEGSWLTPPDALGLRYYQPIPVIQGQSQLDDPVALSDGTANQRWSLRLKPVIAGSVVVTVQEPGGITTRWIEKASLANSTPADRHFVSQRDADGGVTLLFGDNTNGMAPPASTPTTPVPIRATYRVGGGPQGNVASASRFTTSLAAIQLAVNPDAAAGGLDQEDVFRARLFAPHFYRTQDRAVTADDYQQLALQVPGVGKTRAVPAGWNDVVLCVAPSGQVTSPSELLKMDVLAYLESRRMLTTNVHIIPPIPADIYIGALIRAKPYFLRVDVQQAVENAVASYLDFENVDFGQAIYLSKIYDVIQNLEEVASLTVFKFSRSPDLPADIQINPDIASEGVISLQTYELPRPGYRDNSRTPPSPTPTLRPPIYTIIEGAVTQP